jgi:hypothetical protein
VPLREKKARVSAGLLVEAPGVESDPGGVGRAGLGGVQRGIVELPRPARVGRAGLKGADRSSVATLAARALDLLDAGDLDALRAVLADLVRLDLDARCDRRRGGGEGASGIA